MMGTSMLVLPWAFAGSGVLPGLLLTLACGAFCHYTSWIILRWSPGHADFSTICREHLGAWAWHAALCSSMLVLLGASMAYLTLMSDFLHFLLVIARDALHPTPAAGVAEYAWALARSRPLAPIPTALAVPPPPPLSY